MTRNDNPDTQAAVTAETLARDSVLGAVPHLPPPTGEAQGAPLTERMNALYERHMQTLARPKPGQ
ncbi:MAG: hypothetical protein LBM78_00355 [Clostridiales bacterium]|jgi:hypothetical protein|nr:hypothetical protein [Clostridiales bacterium]